MATIRAYRNRGTLWISHFSDGQLSYWLTAQDLWLSRLQKGEIETEALTRALNAWKYHLRLIPKNDDDIALTHEFIQRERINSLSERSDYLYPVTGFHVSETEAKRRQENDLNMVAFALQVPWERERLQRIMRLIWSDRGRDGRYSTEWHNPEIRHHKILRELMVSRITGPLASQKSQLYINSWIGTLKIAIRLYQAENNTLPERLDQLVPRYLDALPAEINFDYRISEGEILKWPPDGTAHGPEGQLEIDLEPGQAVLFPPGKKPEPIPPPAP